MSNETLKTGDLVYVSDESEEQAKKLKVKATVVSKTDRDLICQMPLTEDLR